ncbi:uncharacterized protein LOC123536013 [Mercenaria mercenaria]|uniref:uncharacterized protein LOC123536013 n=1 Tax=Mercenaria mercenaria TaxID=6596 RepID=UPI00234EA5CC|nr:uncharacterized protein LOC123536013 [Mercenaria mercenaria]
MALDIAIIELAFSIQFLSWFLETFTYCSGYNRILGNVLFHGGKEPRISLSIANMFGLLLLREGVHPNPGPISENELEERLTKTFERILGGPDRAESPSLISFKRCLAQVSHDAEATRRSPGDGMNTPPPEPKPSDGPFQSKCSV